MKGRPDAHLLNSLPCIGFLLPTKKDCKDMAAAESVIKSREISTMLKQGFLSDPSLSLSPSRNPLPPAAATRPSPPPSFADAKHRSSPTLFEMMSAEHHHHLHHHDAATDRRRLHERVAKILAEAPFQEPNWGGGIGDVKLTVSSRDGGFKTSMNVHRRVLAARSRFFADKLGRRDGAHSVEICECDDVEVYVEAVVLMYCGEEDLKRRLAKEEVGRVLLLLKVAVAIMFDAGVNACLEYLEAVPWSEDEEEKVISALAQLQLNDPAMEILQRVSVEASTSSGADDIVLHLLMGVLRAKDEKARREMKILILGLLKEDSTHHKINNNRLEVSRETLYHVCRKCLDSLVLCLSQAASGDESRQGQGMLMGEITREADNMQWIVEIMIDKKMGDDFVKMWADQTELAHLHSKIPSMYRYEISRITAQLCIAIGRGQVMVSKDVRFSLLCTWLEPLYDDFGWMKRACKSVDKKTVEDGLSQTILTLPLPQQQTVLLNWFNRFLSKGDDCPNIQRAFEVWWRRAFVRRYSADRDNSHQLQITVCDNP